MDTAPRDWYTEELASIDCCEFIDQYNLEYLPTHEDYHFTTPQDFVERSVSSESYSSYYPTSLCTQQPINETPTTITTMHISPDEPRPNKLHKTNSWTTDFQMFAEASSSPTSKILSFETSSVKDQLEECPPQQQEGKKLGSKRGYSTTASNPSYGQDHIMAERKRREKLNQRFVALSSIVPGLTKMDKASILGDAIKYVKKLQERVEVLEEQTKKRTVESVILLKKSQLSSDGESSDHSELSSDEWSDSVLPEVEARSSDKDVLVRIHCLKQPGIVVKIVSEIENLHLSIVNSTTLPFGASILDMTIIAKMNRDFSMSMKDLVKNLRLAFSKFT